MDLQAGEDIGWPRVRIDVVDPGGVDERIDRGSAASAFIRPAKVQLWRPTAIFFVTALEEAG
jgi:hypothetical protein